MKPTRRDLPALITGAALALQTPLQLRAQADGDLVQKARDSKRAAADLAKVDLPMSTEPAFHFKA
jgi:hypothetical protein